MIIEIGQRIKWVPPSAEDKSRLGYNDGDKPLEGTVINVTGDVLQVDFDTTPPGVLLIVETAVMPGEGRPEPEPESKDPTLAELVKENPEMAVEGETDAREALEGPGEASSPTPDGTPKPGPYKRRHTKRGE